MEKEMLIAINKAVKSSVEKELKRLLKDKSLKDLKTSLEVPRDLMIEAIDSKIKEKVDRISDCRLQQAMYSVIYDRIKYFEMEAEKISKLKEN